MDREKRILLHENATLHEELCKARTEVSLACYTFFVLPLYMYIYILLRICARTPLRLQTSLHILQEFFFVYIWIVEVNYYAV